MDVGLTSKVVLDLMEGLESHHLKLFVDNFYTSPWLFMTLYRKGVNACGTARANRVHFPKQLKILKGKKQVKVGKVGRKAPNTHRQIEPRTMHRGYISYRARGPLLAQVWIDKRVVTLLSTMHNAKPNETVSRTVRNGGREDTTCPSCLPDYQQYVTAFRKIGHNAGVKKFFFFYLQVL